jgi:uncharacterized membrane protein
MSSGAAPNEAHARRARPWAVLLIPGLIAYAVATHWAMGSARSPGLGVALAAAPVLAASLWLALRTRRAGWVGLAALAAAVLLAALAWREAPSVNLLYPVPSAIVYGALMWLFGRTLRPGREALVTHLARRVHGTLPDYITAYTRRVTWAWCLLFGAMALASPLLFSLAPLETWSLFVNVLTFPLIAGMFVLEYVYRLLRYPTFSHVSLLTAVRAFRDLGRAASSGSGR